MSMDSAGSSATRRQVWLCASVLLAAALFLHHEVLWGGMVYHMDDAAYGYYPSHVAALRESRALGPQRDKCGDGHDDEDGPDNLEDSVIEPHHWHARR